MRPTNRGTAVGRISGVLQTVSVGYAQNSPDYSVTKQYVNRPYTQSNPTVSQGRNKKQDQKLLIEKNPDLSLYHAVIAVERSLYYVHYISHIAFISFSRFIRGFIGSSYS